MTIFGLLTAWLAGKLIDALLGAVPQTSPAATGPAPRGATRSRRPTSPQVTPGLARTAPASATVPVSTPPWPQVTPSGLPVFPGPGWVPDNPPPSAVVQRSLTLLPQLWQGGEGTYKVEQTAGRWIAYQARAMGPKKGVVAFREASAPATQATSAPTSQASAPSDSPHALPTLRQGSRGDDVKLVQTHLGIPADGIFGPQTAGAVRAFQARNGLTPDGIVGPKTWGALLGSSA